MRRSYTARLAGDPQVSPPLDDVFRSRVEALKAPSDYLRLLGDYGTHYVTGTRWRSGGRCRG